MTKIDHEKNNRNVQVKNQNRLHDNQEILPDTDVSIEDNSGKSTWKFSKKEQINYYNKKWEEHTKNRDKKNT